MTETSLILASASPYRATILNDLGLSFSQVPADIDESPLEDEQPMALAARLGLEKARKVASTLDPAGSWLVIGSDQVCHHNGQVCGKPGDRTHAIEHLSTFSGDWVTFSTSLALVACDGREFSLVEDYKCRFRDLTRTEIEQYLDLDEPWDCAGAIRIEKSAALLMESTQGRDVNALVGIPVMALREALAEFDLDIFDFIKPS
ncbi:MAG: septum formation protein Maf [Pseudomonadales bacterium]|jgi:septum formation protein|nr:septum formation protein Maf [Pseudomonadales bacterium]